MNKKELLTISLLAMLATGAVCNSVPEAQAARNRSRPKSQPIDNRHNISDPNVNPTRWLETMKRTRVQELFLTQAGLPGHVQQIQQEINRLTTRTNGLTGAQLTARRAVLNDLRNSIATSARNSRFDFNKFGIKFSPITSDLYLQRVNNRLWVNGQPDYGSGAPNFGNGPNY